MNASRILEKKGYDEEDIDYILSSENNSLDEQTRSAFGVDGLPIHLWDGYTRGDADVETLETIANKQGYDEVNSLFRAMDTHLEQLSHEYPEKK